MALTTQTLIAALADGRFHTGEDLGIRFGVSKAAIWKAVRKLEELRLDVHSVRGKGYRLSEPLSLLKEKEILSQITASWRDQLSGLELLHTVDSTNSHALRRVQNDELTLESGRCWAFLSEFQTAGKGRRGREWVSPFGQNLYLTLVREFSNGAGALDGLSLVVGLALVTALDEMGYKGLKLKWPNDILLDGRKLAGILLEVSGDISGQCHVIIGLGVNLRSNMVEMQRIDQPWSALDQAGFKISRRNALAGQVLNKLLNCLHMFEHSGFEPFKVKWRDYDITQGRQLELTTASGVVKGKGLGVDNSGALLMETEAGTQSFHGGEVSLSLNRRSDVKTEQ